MGYTTEFSGSFKVTPPLTKDDREFLTKFSETRHMKRKGMPDSMGEEGEFYVGDDEELNVVDHDNPPAIQPGLWCKWIPSDDGKEIVWNGGEKFYNYIEWIKYLIQRILTPRGYTLNGVITWDGEDDIDRGIIKIMDNRVTIGHGQTGYYDDQGNKVG